jgi:AraC-like DNA-binding protein
MDALSDVLRVAHLTGGVFLHAEFFEPWCITPRVGPHHCSPRLKATDHLVLFHYIVEGSLQVQMEGQTPFDLSGGDVVMFPRNDPHIMGTQLDLTPVLARSIIHTDGKGGLFRIRHGGDGPRCQLVCGYLGCDDVEGNPVLQTLPSHLQLRVKDSGAAEWIRSTFQFAADEIASGKPGSETVMAKLAELLFVETVRRYAMSLPEEETGWLAGLRDPHVARALSLLHGRMHHAWTVDELGREIGLSRSALADRFTRIVGESPMQYLMRWRMHVAARRLRTTHMTLFEIADSVGYESEAAFSRAFRKVHGQPPGAWRRNKEAADT